MCLLQDLHSCLTLSRITIHTPKEAKVGLMNHVSCCPICAYMVKNNYSFLNHIIVRHYQQQFFLWEMPEVRVGQCTANEETHSWLWEAPEGAQEKAFHPQQSGGSAPSSSRSGHKSKKAKKKTGQGRCWCGGMEKTHAVHQPSLSTVATSQEQAPNTPHRSMCIGPPPSLVTSGCPRSRRSQRGPNRVFTHVRAKAFGVP